MTHATDLTARETEIIRLLKLLDSRIGRFIVVGGYAVNALASHRFSVDCDLVIDERDLMLFNNILRREGYRSKGRRELKGIYGGKIQEYVKLVGGRPVSVDLFVNGIVCRQTDGSWSYEMIRQNSLESNVIGLTDSTVSLVPKRELLMATNARARSGRDADLRDVIMLSEGADWDVAAKFVACGTKEKVIAQIESAIETIGKEEFPSALRAEFGLRSDVTPLIKRTEDGLMRVKTLLSKSHFSLSR